MTDTTMAAVIARHRAEHHAAMKALGETEVSAAEARGKAEAEMCERATSAADGWLQSATWAEVATAREAIRSAEGRRPVALVRGLLGHPDERDPNFWLAFLAVLDMHHEAVTAREDAHR